MAEHRASSGHRSAAKRWNRDGFDLAIPDNVPQVGQASRYIAARPLSAPVLLSSAVAGTCLLELESDPLAQHADGVDGADAGIGASIQKVAIGSVIIESRPLLRALPGVYSTGMTVRSSANPGGP